MLPNPAALIEFLAPYPEEVQALTLEARRFLVERYWPVSEIIWDATQAVCAAITFTGESKDSPVNLAVYAKHVTLIFSRGVDLDDPEVRMKGEGTQVRNIRLVDGMATLQDPYILGLIDQACARAPRPAQPVAPKVVVKVMKGPKRRPR